MLAVCRAGCAEGGLPTLNDDGDGQEPDWIQLYRNPPLVIGFKLSETCGLVNGRPARLHTLSPRAPGSAAAQRPSKHPPARLSLPRGRLPYIDVGYATTFFKTQGATLPFVAALLDQKNIMGLGYVAVSRVKRLDNLVFLGDVIPDHLRSVSDAEQATL